MKKILVLNSGSSTLKYQLFSIGQDHYEVIAKGMAERIGKENSQLISQINDQTITKKCCLPNHAACLKEIMKLLIPGILTDINQLHGVGHRLGHGGEHFDKPVLIDNNVMKQIYEAAYLLPLHGKAFILGVEAINEILPQVKQVAAFDTAFHQTMPKEAYLYPLSTEQYKNHGIRRYGFHGTSCKYVSQIAAKYLGYNGKFICCHLGSGASITAIKDGKSVDTSMGLGATTGIIMGTRCGDIDPYIPLYIMEKQNKSADEVNDLLNKESGLYGLSGGYNDTRDLEELYWQGHERAVLALNSYIYRIVKYIGSYIAAMAGADAIIFTAGVGENSSFIRQKICDRLSYFGVEINEKANLAQGIFAELSTPQSKVKILSIPTNEELEIARSTYELVA